MKAGIGSKPIVFLFSDNQIKYEEMIEDISMIINAGDIPNIYAVEDKTTILDSMLNIARESVRLYRVFIYTFYNTCAK